jgi:hypothetical protein
MYWIFGLFISLFIGHVFTTSSLVFLRRYLEQREDEWKEFTRDQRFDFYVGLEFYPPIDPSERQVPTLIAGSAERLFFTLIVAFNVSGAAVAMVGWITLKLLTSRPYREKRAEEEGTLPLAFEFAGLLGNLSSMFFALVGGLICGGYFFK